MAFVELIRQVDQINISKNIPITIGEMTVKYIQNEKRYNEEFKNDVYMDDRASNYRCHYIFNQKKVFEDYYNLSFNRRKDGFDVTFEGHCSPI